MTDHNKTQAEEVRSTLPDFKKYILDKPIEYRPCHLCGVKGPHGCLGFREGPWNCTCGDCPIHSKP